MIFFLSSAVGSKVPGWCYMSREMMADEVGLSKQGILKMVERLVEDGFLAKNEQTKYLQTTYKWQRVYFTDGKQSVPEIVIDGKLSLPTDGKESLPKPGKQSVPYNNTNNNTSDNKKEAPPSIEDKIKEKKTAFFKLIETYKTKNKGKLPDVLYQKFFEYWSETNAKGKLRHEDEQFFEVGKRLGTFWARVTDEERSRMWKQQELPTPASQQQLGFDNILNSKIEEWKKNA
jgi:hypothetical protein